MYITDTKILVNIENKPHSVQISHNGIIYSYGRLGENCINDIYLEICHQIFKFALDQDLKIIDENNQRKIDDAKYKFAGLNKLLEKM